MAAFLWMTIRPLRPDGINDWSEQFAKDRVARASDVVIADIGHLPAGVMPQGVKSDGQDLDRRSDVPAV